MQGQELRTIHSPSAFSALESEWNALALRCPGYFLSQTFQWADTAWKTVARPLGHELACMTLRSEGRLVGVWPLAVHVDRGARSLRPLGFEGAAYCAPLVEPGERAKDRTALLWQAARRAADVIVLRHLREDSLLAGIVRSGGHWTFSDGVEAAPCVARADYPDWPAYQGTISSKLRYTVRSSRRKLARHGELVMARESAATCTALIDWMLEQKRRWLAHAKLDNAWIEGRTCRDFLAGLATREDVTGGAALFGLKLAGEPIAATFVSVNRSRVEGHITAYDRRWHSCSPGNILTEDLMRWAFDRSLDFDFGYGSQPYKFRWARRSCDTVNWQIAGRPRGILRIMRRRAGRLVSPLRQTMRLGPPRRPPGPSADDGETSDRG